jgi:hypothetical protein
LNDNQSLSHTPWECKYHIVWILPFESSPHSALIDMSLLLSEPSIGTGGWERMSSRGIGFTFSIDLLLMALYK